MRENYIGPLKPGKPIPSLFVFIYAEATTKNPSPANPNLCYSPCVKASNTENVSCHDVIKRRSACTINILARLLMNTIISWY